MSSTGAGYDMSPTTFSPEGRIYQVEYAAKAVEKSPTAIGVLCKDGVILAGEKRMESKFLLETSNRRILTADLHVGLAMAGLVADGRKLAKEARKACSAYRRNYGEPVPPKTLGGQLGGLVHAYTCYGAYRPFGVSVLLAGYDEVSKKFELHNVDTFGVCLKYFGCAIGSGRQSAKTDIERAGFEKMTCRDALKHVAKILYTAHEKDEDKPFVLEMGWICEDSDRKFVRVPENLRTDADKWGKEQTADADDDDDDDNDSDESI